MATLHLQLVTPERTLLNEDVDSLSCPTTLGQITILPGHVPLVATLVSGELVARTGTGSHLIHVAGGFAQIQDNNTVVILADSAEHSHEIDISRAEEAIAKAKERLAQIGPADKEYALVTASLERSLQRVRIARKHAGTRTRSVTGQGVFQE